MIQTVNNRFVSGSLRVLTSRRVTSLVLRVLHGALTSQWAESLYVPVELLDRTAVWLAGRQDPDTGAFRETLEHPYDRNFAVSRINRLRVYCQWASIEKRISRYF